MEAITLTDLAPILAAVLGPMLLFAAATMRYQHLDSTKTRDLIDEAREASDQAHKEAREANDQAHKEARGANDQAHKEILRLIDRNHRELSASLGDARERLSRIEGHLGISPPPGRGIEERDADAA